MQTENNPGAATDSATTGTIPAVGRGTRRKDALDAVDRTIIAALRANARIPYADLARLVGLSGPSVADRVRRLEQLGVITGYHAALAPSALGLGVVAIVGIEQADDADQDAIAESCPTCRRSRTAGSWPVTSRSSSRCGSLTSTPSKSRSDAYAGSPASRGRTPPSYSRLGSKDGPHCPSKETDCERHLARAPDGADRAER